MSAVASYRQLNARERLVYELAQLDYRALLQCARALWLVRTDTIDAVATPRQLDALDDVELVAYIIGESA